MHTRMQVDLLHRLAGNFCNQNNEQGQDKYRDNYLGIVRHIKANVTRNARVNDETIHIIIQFIQLRI